MAFQHPTRVRIHRYAFNVVWIYILSFLCFFIPHLHFVQSLSNTYSNPPDRPFQLQHIDHIVLTFGGDNVQPMMEFYTEILGCTIDSPDDIGRMNGRLTHLRAGPNTMIDLMKRDDGKDESLPEGQMTSLSSVDHFCLRIDPFDQEELEEYLRCKGIEIQSSGMRKGAEGVGPSIYIQDPEGNTIELKGPAVKPTTNDESTKKKAMIANSDQKNEESTPQKKEISTQMSEQEPSSSSKEEEDSRMTEVPVTPCTRICRYNADFFGGQVCIGCYREAFEIGSWASMSPSEKYMGLLDAMERCGDEESSRMALDGAISMEELQRQTDYWKKLALEGN